MKYFVNDDCIGCGLCTGSCPEVFEMTADDMAKAIDGTVPEDLEECAHQAMEECPVDAIEERKK